MEPPKGATKQVHQIDLTDRTYSTLADYACRIGKLFASPTVKADPNLAGSLDDFLGAVYALILAKQNDFTDRTAQPIEIGAVEKRALQIAAGKLRTDGKWMAGFYFNSALFRTAAVYHRALKIVVGKPATTAYVSTLRTEVENLFRKWTKAEWSSQHVHDVHKQMNELKHTPRGVHDLRRVTYRDAVSAVAELLELIEAWNGAKSPAAPKS